MEAAADAGPLVSTEARLYAMKELARRARVSATMFRSWKIEITSGYTAVVVHTDPVRCLRFEHACRAGAPGRDLESLITVRAAWTYPPPGRARGFVPDFVVPYSQASAAGRPVFAKTDTNTISFPFDLPLSALLTLARFEETGEARRDEHGRFPAAGSAAFRDDFLHRPIVDEYGLALEQALQCLLPGWHPAEPRLRVKLSHDVDQIGIPFSFRSACGHALKRHRPSACARDVLSYFGGCQPAYLKAVEDIAALSLARGFTPGVYWKASPRGPYDTGYDPGDSVIRRTIRALREQGAEVGVHPGYATYRRPQRLMAEVQRLAEVIGGWPAGGRQHYLRWSPQSWADWESCSLSYDSSVGYADCIGFRAGTAIPYRPWLLSENRKAHLLEIPLLVMDGTLSRYMGLTPRESLERVIDCVGRCRAVGGVFTLLWHPNTLLEPQGSTLYSAILDEVRDAADYEPTPRLGFD